MNIGKWIGFAVLCVSLFILLQIRQVLLLGFMAVVLACAMNAIVRQLMSRFKLKRSLAIPVVVGLLIGFFGIFGLLVIPPFIAQSQELSALVPRGVERLIALIKWVEEQIPGINLSETGLLENLNRQISPMAGAIFANFFAIFSNSLLVLLNTLLVIVLTLMFLVEPEKYRAILVRLFPAFYRRRVDEILKLCETGLDNWLAGTLFNMFVIGVSSFIGLLVLQVRLPLASALIAGLLEAIPNVGPTMSVIPPMAIALLDAPWKAVAVLVLYLLIQQAEQYFLVPTVMAKQVSLLPAVTLLSQIAFAIFFGFLGLLLALPLVVVGQIWIKEVLIKDVLDHWKDASDSLEETSPDIPSPLAPPDAQPTG
ncbi:MAG: AI-2E family transporter [Thermosynechococcaceae cyanobacterium MS004]|nr:AI-2E family transporter [Thermosynechococcaceae cyanobacterium MS004]